MTGWTATCPVAMTAAATWSSQERATTPVATTLTITVNMTGSTAKQVAATAAQIGLKITEILLAAMTVEVTTSTVAQIFGARTFVK